MQGVSRTSGLQPGNKGGSDAALCFVRASRMEPSQFDRQPGRKLQIGGALALALGVILLIALHAPRPGSPVDIHPIGWAFVVVGAFCLAAGTIGRKLLL